MTPTNSTRWTLATTLSLAAALGIPSSPAAQTEAVRIVISDPGKTGLAAGRYRVVLPAPLSGTPAQQQISLIADASPSRRHRYPARVTGCGGADAAKTSWAPRIVNRPDGSLQLQLVSNSAPGCRILAAIPGIEGSPIGTAGAPAQKTPGIEGSPIGTAGAPARKTPGIEGSPIGTAGAPQTPGGGGRAGSADRELEQAILEARQALTQMSCANASARIQSRLAPLRSSLQDVAGAAAPAAAVGPLRRFDAARQALYKSLAGDRTFAAGAKRCADAERRCAASGGVGSGCGIEAAVCLAGVLCTQR